MNNDVLPSTFIAAMAGSLGWPMPMPRRTPPKPQVRCGLPGCNALSTKDYCSKEHCLEHRNLLKGLR